MVNVSFLYSLLIFFASVNPVLCGPLSKIDKKINILIDTDLGGDPDDIQSLFRVLHYSDYFHIRGIVSTPNLGNPNHPWDTIPQTEVIKHWVQRVDLDYLHQMGYTNLMNEAEVLEGIRKGAQRYGAPGPGFNTEGSDFIIRTAKQYSSETPLWILVWGAFTTVAQALHDDSSIAPNIRIYYIGSTNTQTDSLSRNYIYQFMCTQYPDLWWIENGVLPKWSHETFRGIYHGGYQEGEWGNKSFVQHNIRNHGSTHNGLFKEKCGDAFPLATSPEGTLKEGDSPSLLYLLSPFLGKVGNIDDPTCESWGGQFKKANPGRFPNYYIDINGTPEECQATINKWRIQFMSDWKMRWDRYHIRHENNFDRSIDTIPGAGFYIENADMIATSQPGPHTGGGSTLASSFFTLVPNLGFEFRRRILLPGSSIGYHTQTDDEIHYILSGKGQFTLNGSVKEVVAGDALLTRAGNSHGLSPHKGESLEIIIFYPKQSK